MNKTIYRQYDSRWGNLPYPSKPYTLSRSGCGCVAVTHCAIERDKYKNYTPKDVRKYMVQFATRGHGTLWEGIKKGLEYYGYNVHWVQRNDPMSDAWKYLKNSLKRGIILFGDTKGPDGTVWTFDGHFIAFTDYKIEKGKHWFYLKDSGARKHDKWWCYEKSMKGDVRQVFICTSLKDSTKKKETTKTTPKKTTPQKVTKPTGKYSGTIPTGTLKKGSSGEQVKNLQRFLNWYHPAWNITVGGHFKDLTEKCLRSFQATEGSKLCDGIYGKWSKEKADAYKAKKTNQQKLLDEMKYLAWAYGTAKKKYDYKTGHPKDVCKKAMKKYGWADNRAEMSDCGNFASTVIRETGINTSFKALHGIKTAFPKSEKGFTLVLSGREIPSGFLKPADFIRYKKKNGKQHAMFYFGDGKVCEASHHSVFGVIRKDTKRYNTQSKHKTIQVFRVKE